ncbi:MAG: hypothetical protein GC190_08700 [Alphaproteobacteria bacterium]|nr:hypothetical protein [Alphaproteobacteria bacterium]
MHKLPVFRTFGRAVGFTLWNFFTIFRLSWFPFALFIATNIAIGVYAQQVLMGSKPMIDPFSIAAHIDDFVFLNVLVLILQAITFAAVAVSLHRIILFGDRKPGVWINFPFGRTEALFVVMGLISGLIIFAILAVVLAPAFYFVAGGDIPSFISKIEEWAKDFPRNDVPKTGDAGFGTLATMGPLLFSYFVGWIVCIYVSLRLVVWPPAIVATRRLSLGEAWRLSRGNVWRFIGLFLLAISPFYILVVGLAGASYWYYTTKIHDAPPPTEAKQIVETVGVVPATKDTPATVTPPTPEQVAKDEAEREQQAERAMEAFQPFAPAFWLIELLVEIFVAGLTVALLSFSYKALKGYDAHEPIPDDT